jgi:hypothetical protein
MNATGHLGHFLAVTFGALRVRFFVLSDGFGALEGLAAFLTTILVCRHVSPPHFRLNGSNEVALPQLNTAMSQNVVSGGAMEIKIGHHEVNQVGLAFEAHCVFTERQPDVTILRAINVTGLEGLHERQCLSEPRLFEIGKGLLGVVVFWHFDSGKPRNGSLSEIGCNLHLTNESGASR